MSRNDLFKELRKRGLGVQLHYIPVTKHPFYVRLGYKMDGLPQTEAYFETALSIPLHPGMEIKDIERVEKELSSLLST